MESLLHDQFSDMVVQIATPYTIGTGFCLSHQPLIVTSEYIVRDNRMVVVDHPQLGKDLAEVVYLDPKKDLALLRMPGSFPVFTVPFSMAEAVEEGQSVWAIGSTGPEDKRLKKGQITSTDHDISGIHYLLHDALLTGSDSGGPLLDASGALVGINTYMIKNGRMIGFSLPVYHLRQALTDVQQADGKTACRCFHCSTIVYDDNPLKNNCPECGQNIQLPALITDYEPLGIAATIEHLLEETGHQVVLSRRGPNCWQVQQGSAEINISYYEKNGLIVGDAHLCELPPEDNKALFAFLLRQNFEIENLTFSIKDRDIVLSLMIYDRYLNEKTGRTLFQYLFQQADDYDNVLVEQYGAVWKNRKIDT